MTIHCTDRNLTYEQIRHIVLEEAAQAILDSTFQHDGKTYQSLNAKHFANLLREMRHKVKK